MLNWKKNVEIDIVFIYIQFYKWYWNVGYLFKDFSLSINVYFDYDSSKTANWTYIKNENEKKNYIIYIVNYWLLTYT